MKRRAFLYQTDKVYLCRLFVIWAETTSVESDENSKRTILRGYYLGERASKLHIAPSIDSETVENLVHNELQSHARPTT